MSRIQVAGCTCFYIWKSKGNGLWYGRANVQNRIIFKISDEPWPPVCGKVDKGAVFSTQDRPGLDNSLSS